MRHQSGTFRRHLRREIQNKSKRGSGARPASAAHVTGTDRTTLPEHRLRRPADQHPAGHQLDAQILLYPVRALHPQPGGRSHHHHLQNPEQPQAGRPRSHHQRRQIHREHHRRVHEDRRRTRGRQQDTRHSRGNPFHPEPDRRHSGRPGPGNDHSQCSRGRRVHQHHPCPILRRPHCGGRGDEKGHGQLQAGVRRTRKNPGRSAHGQGHGRNRPHAGKHLQGVRRPDRRSQQGPRPGQTASTAWSRPKRPTSTPSWKTRARSCRTSRNSRATPNATPQA